MGISQTCMRHLLIVSAGLLVLASQSTSPSHGKVRVYRQRHGLTPDVMLTAVDALQVFFTTTCGKSQNDNDINVIFHFKNQKNYKQNSGTHFCSSFTCDEPNKGQFPDNLTGSHLTMSIK